MLEEVQQPVGEAVTLATKEVLVQHAGSRKNILKNKIFKNETNFGKAFVYYNTEYAV